ncbi:predicted protein [Lichtheimia corymbifera JMRC:FSU:9682]|uniref:Uncharacterized protein n=2 Tax=Lichtheimia corymbifera JMRC:FSU:9682 TaxID=1263082 RepID=A0A068RSQ2_9FUNG|nr:predicted protein [Lichtheimia corymbifera JMRC:FSU:9682]
METQSVWRRGHFLFDVHSGGHPFTNSSGTGERVSPDLPMPTTSQGCTAMTTTLALDHGLIYHNPTLPLESVSSPTTIRRPFVRFPPFQSHYDHGLPMYQGGDFDSFFADKEREQPVFGGEHNEVFRICPSSIHKTTTTTTTNSDPHHYRLKTPEKRESSTDSSDDDYSHKRPKI